MLFVYTDYEASGGMRDFWDSFNSPQEAKDYVFNYISHYTGEDSHFGYWINHSAHIYSLSEDKIISETYATEARRLWGWKDINETI